MLFRFRRTAAPAVFTSAALLLSHFAAPRLLCAEPPRTPEPQPPHVVEASDEGIEAMAAFKVPDGWTVELVAAEPDVANIVAFDIDAQGRFFVCETFRQNRGVTDNRGHDDQWLQRDLAAQTVQDRIDYHRELLGDEVARYTEQDDRIRMLEDTTGDGMLDRAVVFAAGFNALEEGTGAGVLVRGQDVFYTCIPRLWKLTDTNGDGQADQREVLSEGYGVRVAFRGHDLHGLVMGHDGRLYFSLGDRGYHIITEDGRQLADPASGAVFRCDLDGGNLEVVARGLRNPQELAFNDYGDLFTGDNNSDSGDKSRIVLVLRDGDTGWRMYYQYLPDRGPYNRERIWHDFHEDQPAYIVPPVAALADGPSGLTYYPGTGFGDALKDTFLLADFRGTSGNSGIRSFRVEPEGAFYRLAEDGQPIWSILATDVMFGPDGSIYASDWVDGWDGEGKGRIYRFSDPEHRESAVVREVAELLASDWKSQPAERLIKLLPHPDRRIRLEAQWELAARGAGAALASVATDTTRSTITRLHGIWGVDQVLRAAPQREEMLIAAVRELLSDRDAYVRAAAAQLVGERGDLKSRAKLRALLSDPSLRVRYFATRALADLQDHAALDDLVALLAENDNRDPAIRHGGIMALASLAATEWLAELSDHDSAAVRRAAVVALRRRAAPELARFLEDAETRVQVEAATAIHDVLVEDAMGALAARIEHPMQSEPLIRRVLNANYRRGDAAAAADLARYAARSEAPEAMRIEALEMLGAWASPDGRDRVLNDWRPLPERGVTEVVEALRQSLDGILTGPEAVRARAIELAAQLGLGEITPLLAGRIEDAALAPAARADSLRALVRLDAEAADVVASELVENEALRQAAPPLAAAALEVLAQTRPAEAVAPLRAAALRGASMVERQTAWDALVTVEAEAAGEVIAEGVQRYIEGDLPGDSWLNVLEAAEERLPPALQERLQQHQEAVAAAEPLGAWLPALEGGDPQRGKVLFFTRTELSCVRCHKVDGQGGDVGPDLSGIALQRDRRYLLESITHPDAAIAEGFETTVVADDLGQSFTGIVRSETDEHLELVQADGSVARIALEDVVARRRGKSAMPEDLVKYVNQRELRDLVAYMATLKNAPGATRAGAHGEEAAEASAGAER